MKTTKDLQDAVSQYQNGNKESFKRLYELSYPYLYTCIIHVVRNREAAEDMLQETYLEISRNIGQLNQTDSFLHWAAVIANRKCLEWLKKEGRFPLADVNSMPDATMSQGGKEPAENEEFLPEDILQNREKRRLLWEMIDELSEMQRFCVIAFYFEELSQQQIAEQAGIPVNTVKSHLNRAKKKIKEAVLELEKKDGTRLYALAPFLLLLLGMEAEACEIPVMPEKLDEMAGSSKASNAKEVHGQSGVEPAKDFITEGKTAASGKMAAIAAAACMVAGVALLVVFLTMGAKESHKTPDSGTGTSEENTELEGSVTGSSEENTQREEEKLLARGELFVTDEYEDFGYAYGGSIPVKKDGMWGAVNYANEIIVPFSYDGFFSAPDNLGNFVLTQAGNAGTEYFLFNNQGEILYQGTDSVRASGGMYILGPKYEYVDDYEQRIQISYHSLDGAELVVLNYCSDRVRVGGFYEGISTLCASQNYDSQMQFVTVDLQGNLTWRPAPFVGETENRWPSYYGYDTETYGGNPVPGAEANVATAEFSLFGDMVSTMNHGYYVVTATWDPLVIMYDADDNQVAYFNWTNLFIDENGKVGIDNDHYNDTSDFWGFFSDGGSFYNYGSRMVFTVENRCILVDLAKNSDAWGLDIDATVAAVYDSIYMADEDYWLVQSGEKWGYIDHDGNEMALYEDAGDFTNGYAMVREAGEVYLIDTNFERLQELGRADSVSKLGELYCVYEGDLVHIYQIEDILLMED